MFMHNYQNMIELGGLGGACCSSSCHIHSTRHKQASSATPQNLFDVTFVI